MQEYKDTIVVNIEAMIWKFYMQLVSKRLVNFVAHDNISPRSTIFSSTQISSQFGQPPDFKHAEEVCSIPSLHAQEDSERAHGGAPYIIFLYVCLRE